LAKKLDEAGLLSTAQKARIDLEETLLPLWLCKTPESFLDEAGKILAADPGLFKKIRPIAHTRFNSEISGANRAFHQKLRNLGTPQ